ncbi:MAG: hypothetical protein IJS01_14525 [Lentisphaeria bacterium]|nr:hypothetical protein [Lentisphaeria bacterium]
MTIGFLYIATGKYMYFWKDFFLSCEKFFIPEARKHYFIFTDDTTMRSDDNITIIPRQCAGFPADSLFRFEMFLSIRELLQKQDYVFFLNANMQIVDAVGEEILPTAENGFLVGVLHPAEARKRPPWSFPYERSPRSLAYIPPNDPPYNYFTGAINGGRTPEFLAMSQLLADNIRKDYDKGIIARFHDESHLNRFFHSHHPLTMDCRYCAPEGWDVIQNPKIMMRDKVKVSEYFRKQRDGLVPHMLKGARCVFDGIRWYLHV